MFKLSVFPILGTDRTAWFHLSKVITSSIKAKTIA